MAERWLCVCVCVWGGGGGGRGFIVVMSIILFSWDPYSYVAVGKLSWDPGSLV